MAKRIIRGVLQRDIPEEKTGLLKLPAMKLAPPVWEYPPTELALEVGYHVVYGLGAAAAYAALDR